MHKADRTLRTEVTRANDRRRKAAVYLLGHHSGVCKADVTRKTLKESQPEPLSPGAKRLDKSLPWWRRPTSFADIDKRTADAYGAGAMSSEQARSLYLFFGGERMWHEVKMLYFLWSKPTKAEKKRRKILNKWSMVLTPMLSVYAGLFSLMKAPHAA